MLVLGLGLGLGRGRRLGVSVGGGRRPALHLGHQLSGGRARHRCRPLLRKRRQAERFVFGEQRLAGGRVGRRRPRARTGRLVPGLGPSGGRSPQQPVVAEGGDERQVHLVAGRPQTGDVQTVITGGGRVARVGLRRLRRRGRSRRQLLNPLQVLPDQQLVLLQRLPLLLLLLLLRLLLQLLLRRLLLLLLLELLLILLTLLLLLL